MSKVKVMGHCPPDTDSTCSPVAYAWFLKTYKNIGAQAYVGGKLNKEAEFVLKYFNVETPESIESVAEGDQLVLIDTNNPEELISNWEKAQIIEIVDHHKLYGLKTDNIPTVTIRTYGCVSTVLWELMARVQSNVPKEIAGLMGACIISDTLKLTSPTTTATDKKALEELAVIAGINIDTFANEMFAAKSNLDGMSAHNVLLTDAKNFEFGQKVYKIGVLETTNPEQAISKRTELEAEMENIKQSEGLAGFLFFVVDIIKAEATLLPGSNEEAELAEKAFSKKREPSGLLVLPEVVSRKKQIVPAVETAVNS